MKNTINGGIIDEMSLILFKNNKVTGAPVLKTAQRSKFWVPKICEDELCALRLQCGLNMTNLT